MASRLPLELHREEKCGANAHTNTFSLSSLRLGLRQLGGLDWEGSTEADASSKYKPASICFWTASKKRTADSCLSSHKFKGRIEREQKVNYWSEEQFWYKVKSARPSVVHCPTASHQLTDRDERGLGARGNLGQEKRLGRVFGVKALLVDMNPVKRARNLVREITTTLSSWLLKRSSLESSACRGTFEQILQIVIVNTIQTTNRYLLL